METNNLEELYGSYKNYNEVVTNLGKSTLYVPLFDLLH